MVKENLELRIDRLNVGETRMIHRSTITMTLEGAGWLKCTLKAHDGQQITYFQGLAGPPLDTNRESKLTVPGRNEESLVATTPGQDYLNKKVEINHTPEIKGGLKALIECGIKITHYEEHIPK